MTEHTCAWSLSSSQVTKYEPASSRVLCWEYMWHHQPFVWCPHSRMMSHATLSTPWRCSTIAGLCCRPTTVNSLCNDCTGYKTVSLHQIVSTRKHLCGQNAVLGSHCIVLTLRMSYQKITVVATCMCRAQYSPYDSMSPKTSRPVCQSFPQVWQALMMEVKVRTFGSNCWSWRSSKICITLFQSWALPATSTVWKVSHSSMRLI